MSIPSYDSGKFAVLTLSLSLFSLPAFPPEYCEFSSSTSRCKTWLESAHPDLFTQIWSEEALTQKMSNLTAKQAEDLEKDAAKKEKKAEAKAEKEKRTLAVSG